MKLTRTLRVVNKLGLHARAATRLAQVAHNYDANIQIIHGSQSADANSVLAVLMLETCQGQEVTIICDGDDAEPAMTAISELFSARFDESE
ncbi:HPr-like nitrogen-regulatory protein NPr [Ferrimonas sediminum]|uniref:HPr-like nitrogen-regulatory protein NPr n=1 Tax=Ferrimonas sediminum TaxID=718193 RepID=A0A1G8KB70_9GAMM|nr:HPr family phosphocarrier protein [Ferrimonas sediminum]SDI40661.1 HPr-like nitrogen-regulatory protein NPr [Ferrimonas sediminum]